MKYFISLNTVKLILISFLFIYILPLHNCAMGVPEKGYDYLTPPYITGITQQGTEIILLQFEGYNDEYYFDGYNIYISTTSLNRDMVNSYKPVQVDMDGYASSEPSFPLSPDDYNPAVTREAVLYHYYINETDPYPFSEGTYFIFMCSHHRLGYVLPEAVSNQVSIVFQ